MWLIMPCGSRVIHLELPRTGLPGVICAVQIVHQTDHAGGLASG